MRMTRRSLLQSAGAAAVSAGLGPLAHAGAKQQATANGRSTRTLVVVFLRGGIDGLNWFVPYGDPHYHRLRPTLKLDRPGERDGVLDLDGFFGLHPAAAPLLPWFRAGQAAAVHAVGHAGNTRSHFAEQDAWETGVADDSLGTDGWLSRHLLTSRGRGPVRAVALAESLPLSLRGRVPAFATENTEDAERIARLVEPTAGNHAATAYPSSPLARRLRNAARLIRAGVGLEVVHVDHGGWDTHNRQGRGTSGTFARKLAELSPARAAFARDLGPRLDDTLVLTLSEFGRTAAENATGGTDHGGGNALLALGGPARVGRRPVICDWPGLAPSQLVDGRDLRPTVDFRDVLAEAIRLHLGDNHLSNVLPGHGPKPVGLIA